MLRAAVADHAHHGPVPGNPAVTGSWDERLFTGRQKAMGVTALSTNIHKLLYGTGLQIGIFSRFEAVKLT
jgi:hypothetical protein